MGVWTPEEMDRLRGSVGEGHSAVFIGIALGRSPTAVEHKAKRMGLPISESFLSGEKRYRSASAPQEPATAETEQPSAEDRKEARRKLEQEEAREAVRKHGALLKEKVLEDRIVETFRSHLAEGGVRISLSKPSTVPRVKAERTPHPAVLVLSDTHVGKIVDPAETNGLGDYDPARFLGKLQHLEETVAEILARDHPCSELHVMLLGDLVEGALNHSEEIPERLHVTDQCHLAALALWQFLARLSLAVPKVRVTGLVGNHARWGTQKKPPTSGRFSNFDSIVLEWMQSLNSFGKLPNVEFALERGQFQIVDVAGWRFLTSHGDQLRGGDKAMGVPIHAIAREINSFTARLHAQGQKTPDYYIVGDKHKAISLPTARGEFIVNGAWSGIDGYSLSGGFAPNRPQQLLFGVHPGHGKSWAYNLYLDQESEPAYALPESLQKIVTRYAHSSR